MAPSPAHSAGAPPPYSRASGTSSRFADGIAARPHAHRGGLGVMALLATDADGAPAVASHNE
jgi:hypothetical protein